MITPTYRTQTGQSVDDLLEYAVDMGEFHSDWFDDTWLLDVKAQWEKSQSLTEDQFNGLVNIVNMFELQAVEV